MTLPRNLVLGDPRHMWTLCPWDGPPPAAEPAPNPDEPPKAAPPEPAESADALLSRLATVILRAVAPFPDAYRAICAALRVEFPVLYVPQ